MILMLAFAWSTPVYAHGSEAHYGAPINTRSFTFTTSKDRGALDFTLLAISGNLSALERDLEKERMSEVRERARRLPGMAYELVARSPHLGELERKQVGLTAQVILESAERMETAANGEEAHGVLREVTFVRARIAALQNLLRDLEN